MPLTIGGDIMFTEKSGEYFTDRWEADYVAVVGATNDIPIYKGGALKLYQDIWVSAGQSASAWDNFNTTLTPLPAYFPTSPNPRTYEAGPSGAGYTINNSQYWVWELEHDGALQAKAWDEYIKKYGDSTITYNGDTQLMSVFRDRMAYCVFKAIDDNATRPELDATNGTNPFWTNPTYGITVRFNPNDDDRGDPWFVCNGKLAKTMKSLSVVAPMLEASGDTYYSTNHQRVFYWCKGWADITYSCLDNLMQLFFDSDWSTVGATTSSSVNPSLYTGGNSGSSVMLYTHYTDTNGNNPVNPIMGVQVAAFNNREWAAANMVLTYGILFDDQTKITAIENYFKLYIQIATFADSTPSEMFRGGENFDFFAVNYSHILIAEMCAAAKSWAVGVKNGFPSMVGREMGELFDYTTTRGSTQVYGGNWDSVPTENSNGKSLETLMNNVSKYHRNPSDGGFKGTRFNQVGADLGTSQGDFRQWSVASSWYGTASETWTHAQYQTSDGYVSQTTIDGGSAGYPDEDGQAWGALRVNGGYVPTHGLFDIWEGVSGVLFGSQRTLPIFINC
ncbi:hypothetical protein PANI_CDS0093 [Maribacter phage Panino]